MKAIVLLSGGMDSAVALYWAASVFDDVDAITFDYQQRSRQELRCAGYIWLKFCGDHRKIASKRKIISLDPKMFGGEASILGRSEVTRYKDAQDAVAHTSSDPAYIPLRNAIFTTLAAHHLLCSEPKGGTVVLGTRGRDDGPGGYPDCTRAFAQSMERCLTQAAGAHIEVIDPLNILAPSRAKTIAYARTLKGCFEALGLSSSCFNNQPDPCGKCLPCQRRAEAFAALGLDDPALSSMEF